MNDLQERVELAKANKALQAKNAELEAKIAELTADPDPTPDEHEFNENNLKPESNAN